MKTIIRAKKPMDVRMYEDVRHLVVQIDVAGMSSCPKQATMGTFRYNGLPKRRTKSKTGALAFSEVERLFA